MFDKIKEIGSQVASKANETVDGINTSVKGKVESITSTATNVVEAINEKAVRASTVQMCNILEIAMEELKNRPLSARPVTLKTTVNIGIAALEMKVHLDQGEANHEHTAAKTE